MKKLSKKQIKQHNKFMDLKKELSLLFLITSFLKQYSVMADEKNNNMLKDVKCELLELSKKTFLYSNLTEEILKVAQNEMEIIEQIQRSSKPAKFKKICSFDKDNDLVVSAIGLVANLLHLHKEHKNKKIFLSNNVYNLSNYKADTKDEVKNAMVVASNFYDRICKYYDDRKLI